jgi:hypothetical protein
MTTSGTNGAMTISNPLINWKELSVYRLPAEFGVAIYLISRVTW